MAQGWFSYDLEYEESEDLRDIVRAEYAADFQLISQTFPESVVRIGIGVTRTISGFGEPPSNLIISFFDHPFFCHGQSCRLVMLIKDAVSGNWIEVFDGYSDGMAIVRTDTAIAMGDAFNWCISAFESAQLLSWDGRKFRVRWDKAGRNC